MAPRWLQDGPKMVPRWLQNAASNATLFQEASKTSLALDFYRFWSPLGSIFVDFFKEFLFKLALESFIKFLNFN